MFGKHFGYILFPTLIVCSCMTILTAAAKFSYRHPYAKDEKFAVTRAGVIVHKPIVESSALPEALVSETKHDFGHMDPLTMGKHSFVVRNQGEVPLELQAGPTSCKCTLGQVSDEPIPPGGEGLVTVEWNTGRDKQFYSHNASIYTNDPRQKMVTFSIRGIVRMQLAVDPPRAVFERIDPDESVTRKLFVYSQMWDDFEIQDVRPSREGLGWKIEPAGNEQLASYDALSGYWLHVTTSPGSPQGSFSDWLQFNAQPTGQDAERVEHQVAVVGKTLRRLAVYGPGIDSQGIVTLGKINKQDGAAKRLLLKVRDVQRNLTVKRIETTPDYLDVRVTATKDSLETGLMYLDVTIPPGAPRGNYLSRDLAEIRVEFEHPRIADLELKARFAVTD